MHIAQTALERLKALPGYPHIEEFPAADPYLQLPTLEQTIEDMRSDENIIAIREKVEARKRQADAEIGWEQFANAKGHQMAHDLHNATHALGKLAQLNRALYESGQYGPIESEDAKVVRQEIAANVYVANEALERLLGAGKQEQDTQGESGSVAPS